MECTERYNEKLYNQRKVRPRTTSRLRARPGFKRPVKAQKQLRPKNQEEEAKGPDEENYAPYPDGYDNDFEGLYDELNELENDTEDKEYDVDTLDLHNDFKDEEIHEEEISEEEGIILEDYSKY